MAVARAVLGHVQSGRNGKSWHRQATHSLPSHTEAVRRLVRLTWTDGIQFIQQSEVQFCKQPSTARMLLRFHRQISRLRFASTRGSSLMFGFRSACLGENIFCRGRDRDFCVADCFCFDGTTGTRSGFPGSMQPRLAQVFCEGDTGSKQSRLMGRELSWYAPSAYAASVPALLTFSCSIVPGRPTDRIGHYVKVPTTR